MAENEKTAPISSVGADEGQSIQMEISYKISLPCPEYGTVNEIAGIERWDQRFRTYS